MKKNKIIVTKSQTAISEKETLSFYLTNEQGRFFLFHQEFSKGVWEFFKDGVAEAQLYKFKWHTNERLDKTVMKIPMYIKFALREDAA